MEGAGALVERDYRLLFAATVVTALGDAVATIALAFAVLDFGDATDLGIVLAVRQVASAGVLLFGGVLSDRVARNKVLVGASLVQGVAQAAMAGAVLSSQASLAVFVGLGVLWGLGDGLVVPAEAGLVPQTVSPARLQQANALQGLSRSGVRVLGPAIGGVLVVTLGPGWALAVDSVSFFACAVLLGRIRLAPRLESVRQRMLVELRDGWHEFRSRTWLWSTVLLFGVGNMVFMFWPVLGPTIAEQRLGGAGAWGVILAAGGAGAILGGMWALRHRPARPLVACILWAMPAITQLVTLAIAAPRGSSSPRRSRAGSASPTTSRCGSRRSSGRFPSTRNRASPLTTRSVPSSSARSAPRSPARWPSRSEPAVLSGLLRRSCSPAT
jgi:MFS family permease